MIRKFKNIKEFISHKSKCPFCKRKLKLVFDCYIHLYFTHFNLSKNILTFNLYPAQQYCHIIFSKIKIELNILTNEFKIHSTDSSIKNVIFQNAPYIGLQCNSRSCTSRYLISSSIIKQRQNKLCKFKNDCEAYFTSPIDYIHNIFDDKYTKLFSVKSDADPLTIPKINIESTSPEKLKKIISLAKTFG